MKKRPGWPIFYKKRKSLESLMSEKYKRKKDNYSHSNGKERERER